MLMTVTGLAQTGPMIAAPAGEGAVHAWSVPYNPVSPGMVTGLQDFLRTDIGASLLTQAPSLGIIGRLSPDSEVHRRIIGVLGLSADFQTKLQVAVQNSDNKALADTLGTILNAYRGQNAEEKISIAVQARADDIADAINKGKMSTAQLSAAASELAPFTPISAKAKAVEDMASAARSEMTMDTARRIASTLMYTKGSLDSDETSVTNKMDGIITDADRNDSPLRGRLQPASQNSGAKADLASLPKLTVVPTAANQPTSLDRFWERTKAYFNLNAKSPVKPSHWFLAVPLLVGGVLTAGALQTALGMGLGVAMIVGAAAAIVSGVVLPTDSNLPTSLDRFWERTKAYFNLNAKSPVKPSHWFLAVPLLVGGVLTAGALQTALGMGLGVAMIVGAAVAIVSGVRLPSELK
jgi:hypothetical protein